MRSVKFNDRKYYFFYSKSASFVLDNERKKISSKDLKECGFKNEEQFAFLLNQLYKKIQKSLVYDEQGFCQVISDNLLTLDDKPLSILVAKTLLKGVNYAVLKLKDYKTTVDTLYAICSKNNLKFHKIPLDIKISLKDVDKTFRRYLSSPYGSLAKDHVMIAPILVEPFLQTCLKSN